MSTAALVEDLVKSEVEKWNCGQYSWSLTALSSVDSTPDFPHSDDEDGDKAEVEGALCHRFLVSWSRPSPQRPVPDAVVHATVEAALKAGGDASIKCQLERESTSFTSEEMAKLLLPALERQFERKRRVVADSGVDLVEPFNRDRLPSSYEPDADEEAAALAIQRVARGNMARRNVAAKQATAAGAETYVTQSGSADAGVGAGAGAAGADGDDAAAGGATPLPDGEEKEAELWTAEEEDSAKQMQRLARGRAARKRVEGMKEEKQAAVQMQRMARGRAARKRVEAMKST